jgi:hypothetical protein
MWESRRDFQRVWEGWEAGIQFATIRPRLCLLDASGMLFFVDFLFRIFEAVG